MKIKVMLSVLALSAWSAAHAGNLLVEVRIDGQSASDGQDVGLGVQNGIFGMQGTRRTVTRRESNQQRLLVMDGGTATLSSVQTQPLRLRQVIRNAYGQIVSDIVVFRSLGGGIRVTPRSRGDFVEIEVGAEEARPVPGHPTATDVLQLSTQISGRMGEWIMVGDDQRSGSGGSNRTGAGLDGSGGGVGIGARSGESSSGQQVWLRVMPQ
ncbi:MAG: hypothetical protein K2X64_08035 [Rhodocyclaceae bacterium]|nr:hypothetical protein [Rhodocyclaceae bacterium]